LNFSAGWTFYSSERQQKEDDMAQSAKTYGNEARNSVEDAASRFADKASNAAGKAQDKLEDAGDTVRDYTRYAADQMEHSVRKYPLSTIAGAAVLGLLIGTILKR
jgi:ElaB/YqjD/DUF883 family membrane-anchored ribosome-binding protein